MCTLATTDWLYYVDKKDTFLNNNGNQLQVRSSATNYLTCTVKPELTTTTE
jgi:hypothetical protein